jgi:hypothetical protein
MTAGKAAQRCATNSVALDKILQCYVLASLLTTSGVDVLLLITLAFLLFAFVWQSVALLKAALAQDRGLRPLNACSGSMTR